jgi:hypothetical protein
VTLVIVVAIGFQFARTQWLHLLHRSIWWLSLTGMMIMMMRSGIAAWWRWI